MSYIDNAMADVRLGCAGQAWAILHLLAEREPAFADWDEEFHSYRVRIYTWPFYNGRERGFCVGMQPPGSNRTLFVVFGENRTSDETFVDSWWGASPLNGPTIEQLGPSYDRAYAGRRFFEHTDEAADYIYELMARAYRELSEESER